MKIRELKNRLVDVILHIASTVEDSTAFGDDSQSWIITNSVIDEFLKFVINGEGVTVAHDDGFDVSDEFIPWDAFPQTYKEEIVSALSVDMRVEREQGLRLRELFRF